MVRTLLFGAAAMSLAVCGATPVFAVQRQPLTLVQQALMITYVFPGGSAAQQGLQPGDVIVSINGNPVRSLMDLNRLVGQSGAVAQLQVIDCNSGSVNQVAVYPTFGRIGVAVQVVPLDNIGRGGPGRRPGAQPIPASGIPGGQQPRPSPQPGLGSGTFPGR